MLRDIIDGIVVAQPDLEICEYRGTQGELDEALEETHADVVIVGDVADSRWERWSPLIYRWPRLKVLALEQHGRRAALYELRPHREELGELSPPELVAAIREAVREVPEADRGG